MLVWQSAPAGLRSQVCDLLHSGPPIAICVIASR